MNMTERQNMAGASPEGAQDSVGQEDSVANMTGLQEAKKSGSSEDLGNCEDPKVEAAASLPVPTDADAQQKSVPQSLGDKNGAGITAQVELPMDVADVSTSSKTNAPGMTSSPDAYSDNQTCSIKSCMSLGLYYSSVIEDSRYYSSVILVLKHMCELNSKK